jgi:hypothetical protein
MSGNAEAARACAQTAFGLAARRECVMHDIYVNPRILQVNFH